MAKWKIQHFVDESGVTFRLQESTLLHSDKYVPMANWGESGSSKEMAGLTHLIAWKDEEFSEVEDDCIHVPHDQITALSDAAAHSLQLPDTAPYTLQAS